MKQFSALLESLIFSPRRNVKLSHLAQWLQTTPHPDRGWGLAALNGEVHFTHVKAGIVRALAEQATDPELFALSYDFVGDLAETVALLWPAQPDNAAPIPALSDIITGLEQAKKKDVPMLMANWLGQMHVSQRWALLKLVTGGLRVGVSGRLSRIALSQAFDKPVAEIEEIWPLIEPPYDGLFNWLEGKSGPPLAQGRPVFRPMMLAHPLETDGFSDMHLADWQVEWKWDGVRVQLVSAEKGVKIFSRNGDDLSSAFPELVGPMRWKGVLDGELLAGSPDKLGSFNDLQHRLNRKNVSKRMQQQNPCFIRFYDLLFVGEQDLRSQGLRSRRQRLESEATEIDIGSFDLSPILTVHKPSQLAQIHASAQTQNHIEGVMIKRAESPYLAGRPKGYWYKWKRDPFHADLVVLYAQRGHGRRSSLYSDFTLGAWQKTEQGIELVPVCKAYSGFSDAELQKLDKFVREHTANRFGPVREVEHKLVVEIAFDSLHLSKRHKSGLAMRFPRFHAIRWDKDPEEADNVGQLHILLEEMLVY